jgi:prephenate dehydrogenase
MALAAVIGGSGRMGAWFANFLAADKYRVMICDKNEPAARKFAKKHGFKFVKSETHAAEVSDIIVLATPTHVTNILLKKIASHMPRTTLLVEISSIKEPVMRNIETLTRHGTQILSIHPMFGPGAKNLTNKAVIVAQEPRESQLAKRLLSALRKNGAKIIECDLGKHDRIVAATLVLSHFMNFAFIETLKHVGFSLDRAREIGGTSFKLQLLLAEALCHENLSNETSILADNRYSAEVYGAFAQQIDQIRDAIQRKRQSELMNRLRSDAAYVRNDRLFRTAYQRFIAAAEVSSG